MIPRDHTPLPVVSYLPHDRYEQPLATEQGRFDLLGLFRRVIRVVIRRRVTFIAVLVSGLAIIVLLLNVIPKTYEAAARVLIVAASNGRDPSVSSIDLPSVATSTAVLSRVVQKLELPIDLIDLQRSVRAGVKAKSSIMEVKYRDKLADRAVAVPNAIANELVTYYDSLSSSGADVTIRKLDDAIATVQQRLSRIDDAAARQAKMHPFVQSDRALGEATSRLDDFRSQRQAALAALATDTAQENAIAGDPRMQSKLARYEILKNDVTFRELKMGLAKDEAELASMRAAFTEDYPGLRVLEKKVSAERAMMTAHERLTLSSPDAFSTSQAASAMDLRKASATISGDRAKVHAIDALIADGNSRLRDTLTAGLVADRLRLQHDAARADYLALAARRVAAVGSRAEALSLGSVVVVDRAVSADTAVVGLGRTRLGMLMALVVIASATGAALIVDRLDPHVEHSDQILRLYGVPLITTIGLEA